MNKKKLSIIFSLFLVGVFSVSCSNSEQTDPKGIEQYNGNTYVSTGTFADQQSSEVYLWVSVKDNKVGMAPNANNTTAPDFTGSYMSGITGSGSDYSFDSGDGIVAGTLKFTDTSVTVNFTKNTVVPSTIGQDIICNKK
ncbi:hypothetical protein [Brachyspira sp. SAP_772]|uniref:hypothetical protein n=1 Tax=Brachyspira sp. SAP_772 TaxID=2608385 RepID=UPI0012F4EB8C|nr:hypothetical protein [Brachyspira sp. SAP_772]